MEKYSHLVPEMIRLYRLGLAIHKIAGVMGIDKETVARYLDKDGIISGCRIRESTVVKIDRKMREAIKPQEIAAIKERYGIGDKARIKVEQYESREKRSSFRRTTAKVVGKTAAGIIVNLPWENGIPRMVSYVELIQQERGVWDDE